MSMWRHRVERVLIVKDPARRSRAMGFKMQKYGPLLDSLAVAVPLTQRDAPAARPGLEVARRVRTGELSA
jgi:hypothetical protein